MPNLFSFLLIEFLTVELPNNKYFLILLLPSLTVLLKDLMELFLLMGKLLLEKPIQWKGILDMKFLKIQALFQG
jgi:hypothetical protein